MYWDTDSTPENMMVGIGQQVPAAVYHSIASAKPEWIDAVDPTLLNIPDRQGRFTRGANGSNWLAGNTHEDAIRSITGYLTDISGGVSSGSSGVFSNTFLGGVTAGTGASTLYQNTYSFDVSRQVPVAPEIQPKAYIEWVGYAL